MNGYSTCSVIATQENITDLLYFLKERGFVTSTASLDYLVRNPQCKYLTIYVSRGERRASLQIVNDTTHFHAIEAFRCHIIDNFPPNFSVLVKNTEDAKNLIENYNQFFKDRGFDLSSFTLDAYSSKNSSKVFVPLNYLTTNKKGDSKSLCFTSMAYKNWAGRVLCKSVDEFLEKIEEHYKPSKSVETCNTTNSTKVYSIDFRAEYLNDQQNNVLYSWKWFVRYVIGNIEDVLSNKIDKESLTKQLLELSDSDFFLNLYLENGTIVRWVRSTIAPKDSFICYSVKDFRKKLKESTENVTAKSNDLIPISSFYLEPEEEDIIVKSILPPKFTEKINTVKKDSPFAFTILINRNKLLLRRKIRRCS